MSKACAPAFERRHVVYALLTHAARQRAIVPRGYLMTRFDQALAAISDRMHQPSAPQARRVQASSLSSLIERVNSAKQRYQPGRS